AEQVEERQKTEQADNWLKTSLAKLSNTFEGERQLDRLGANLLREMAMLIDAQYGVMYSRDGTGLRLVASYAAERAPPTIAYGQGIVGQVLEHRQRVVLDSIPDDYVKVSSALGNTAPRSLVIFPALLDGEVKTVIELAFMQPCTEL